MKSLVVFITIVLSNSAFAGLPPQAGLSKPSIQLDFPPPVSVEMNYICNGVNLEWSAPSGDVPDGYNVYRKIGFGNWIIRNSQLITDTTFSDLDVILDSDFQYHVRAVYGNVESDPADAGTYYLPDPSTLDYLLVGTESTETLNFWYMSILDSLGLEGAMVDHILPYCGSSLAELPVLWLVSYPRPMDWSNIYDCDIAVMDYLDRNGNLYVDDPYLTMVEAISFYYLSYGFTTCMTYPFMGVDGTQGTFAEGLSFDLADTMWSSNMEPMSGPPEVGVVLEDNVACGCVDLYVDRQGYKAVVNSQAIYEFLDGPNGTRLEYFNRMLNFFGVLTSVDDGGDAELPEDYIAIKAYPNPFNAEVKLSLQSVSNEDREIEIYDITGRKIRSFEVEGGSGEVIIWDGRNRQGEQVASGVYFARLAASGEKSNTLKLTLLR